MLILPGPDEDQADEQDQALERVSVDTFEGHRPSSGASRAQPPSCTPSGCRRVGTGTRGSGRCRRRTRRAPRGIRAPSRPPAGGVNPSAPTAPPMPSQPSGFEILRPPVLQEADADRRPGGRTARRRDTAEETERHGASLQLATRHAFGLLGVRRSARPRARERSVMERGRWRRAATDAQARAFRSAARAPGLRPQGAFSVASFRLRSAIAVP